MLQEFIALNRDEIIRRCRDKVAARSESITESAFVDHGVPMFLKQLGDALGHGPVSSSDISTSAIQHAHDLLRQGFTVSQVVRSYGDVCQSITELALHTDAPMTIDEFRTLSEQNQLGVVYAAGAFVARRWQEVDEAVLLYSMPSHFFAELTYNTTR